MNEANAANQQQLRDTQQPSQVYAHRLHFLQQAQQREAQAEKRLGYTKIIVAFVTLVAAALLLRSTKYLELLLIPLAIFGYLAVLQEKRIQILRLRTRSIAFYERGLARMEGRWQGSGETGERLLDPLHPYARDLDLFGAASLFQLLSSARTRTGERTLAAWLLGAAPIDEARARQEAIRDLRARVDFREQLFTAGLAVQSVLHPDALAAWGERTPVFAARSTRIVTGTLALLWVASLAAWAMWGIGEIAAALTLLNLAWSHLLYARLERAAETIEKAADDLQLLAGLLALLEKETFTAPLLKALQAGLRRDGLEPSQAVRKLTRLAEAINQRHNRFLKPFDLFIFFSALFAFAAERWQQEFGPSIRTWIQTIGELEALASLAAYAFEHPADVFPEFVSAGPVFDAKALGHPLLAADQAVPNDVTLGNGLQVLILSGPNMAGKSTFIRSIGVNAVLAQCGAPVRAAYLRISPLQVAASICILDSLSGGVSRFYAEIHRIKLIFDLSTGAKPVLFLLDELLSGTNSHDRLAGSEFIVRSLLQKNAIGIVSTHDLALTNIPAELGDRAANFHFEDTFDNGRLIFDYKIKPGIVRTSNALQLMRSIGLTVDE